MHWRDRNVSMFGAMAKSWNQPLPHRILIHLGFKIWLNLRISITSPIRVRCSTDLHLNTYILTAYLSDMVGGRGCSHFRQRINFIASDVSRWPLLMPVFIHPHNTQFKVPKNKTDRLVSGRCSLLFAFLRMSAHPKEFHVLFGTRLNASE